MFYFSERNNMFGDDSRLSHLVKRITKESERERRLTAAQQFEEFLSTPDNYQIVDKYAENLFSALEDVLFERGQPELKEKVALCVGLIGGILGNEAGRFFQWIFTKLESSVSDEVKILLLTALSKAIQVDTKNKCFRDFMMNVMSSLQNILENVDTSDLLRAALNVMMPIALDYPHAFAGHFRDTVDILVGWHIDTSQQNSLTSYTSECLVKLHDYWASDIAFSLTLLSQFLEDMEAYAEELGMLSNQVVTSEEIPSPYVSLPRLTALVRVFTTVVNGIGPSFSPNRSPSITPPYLTEVRLVFWKKKEMIHSCSLI
ncbi:serine/threonine-protein kinase SMG1-like isoform X2 [Orbicella faveolata]|uniref:serine/threonine-protein kinase SMG1-like isoform X2 n=1 Tax=Orbicella faveolata TaxID=48498 RepID=UPI0009E18A0C|nr:serine/threonine-protein kinase SMG1-like isoform X2 [Orbicella faveolata]